MQKIIDTIDLAIGKVLQPIVVFLSLLIAFGMVAGIVMRSVFSAPMLGLEEIILFSVMWLYMLGAALASRERSHLSADFISTYVTNLKIANSIRVFATLITLVTVIAFVLWSHSLLAWGLEKQQSTPVFRIPLYFSQGSMFCASMLFLFYVLRDLLNDVHSLREQN